MLLPGVIICLIFAYGPMCGLIMAFQEYNPFKGFFGSRFVGLDNFRYLFHMPDFGTAFFNTLYIAAAKAVLFLAVPLLLALLINEVRSKRYVKTVQTSIFLPYFLSWAILGGIILEIFSLDGIVNQILGFFGQDAVSFLGSNKYARHIIIWTDVWKSMGYNMIVFLAAITNIDPSLYEAASIDGAGRLKQAIHITIPAMAPMIFLLTVLSLGNLLNAGFDQILMLYNPLTYETTDVLDTLVYRIGIYNQQYGIATAMGLFKSVISVTLVAVSNWIAYKFTDYRIF
ncbi:ABC transporter permease subunit [Acetivibrio sp. MSJd-27]|nr:ABC transporter permease subunit [Acetivibrio sp. MSJd-27]